MDKNLEKLYMDFVNYGFEEASKNSGLDSNQIRMTPMALGIDKDMEASNLFKLPWVDDHSKIELLIELGSVCFERNINKIGLIIDTAMKQYETPLDGITDQPLTYPPNMRVDCIVLLYIDFMDADERVFRVFPYTITEGTLVRKEELKFDKNNMNSRISDGIFFGFIKSAMLSSMQEKKIMNSQLSNEIGDKILKEVIEKYPGVFLKKDELTDSMEENHDEFKN